MRCREETIAAISTAPGEGGIAIIRISGARAREILGAAFHPARLGASIESHRMLYGLVLDQKGEPIDEVMAVWMAAPNSYTREDVAEIHCHGGSACAAGVLRRVLELGAVPAGPGEFTKRAFLNGRIDLSRAEAVMQLIGAGGEAARRAALRQVGGGVSHFVIDTVREIEELLTGIQAAVDFPEEVEDAVIVGALCGRAEMIAEQIERRVDPEAARILREGASVVIAGRPNVGKSSLMNALLRTDRAIVTDIPGTTRDVLSERFELGGRVVRLCDTAGMRESRDAIEQIGVRRARKELAEADVVLLVLDASREITPEDRRLLAGADRRCVLCLNKLDLPRRLDEDELPALPAVRLSARTGAGVEALIELLKTRLRFGEGEESVFTVERQMRLARQAAEHLRACALAVRQGYSPDVAAADLWRACDCLNRITGKDTTEEVVASIFANFCVGK